MFGFVVGTACLLGLIHVMRHGRGGCGPRWHRHWGHGPWREGPGFGPRFFLRPIFERLDTSPGQEKVIVDAVDELLATVSDVRREAEALRAEVARAVRQPAIDEAAWAAARSRVGVAAQTVESSMAATLHKIHEVLDDKQRARFAELIQDGPRWMDPWRGHPYRCAC
jgi:Spy/CpxP family protein refolding chaperone